MIGLFAARLKELRRASDRAMTQKELAKKMGVSQQAVAMWERGRNMPSHELVSKIAALFHVSTDYLLGSDDTVFTLDKKILSLLKNPNRVALLMETENIEDTDLKQLINEIRKKRP